MQAALLRVLLPHIDGWNGGRQIAARAYDAAGVAEFATPQLVPEGSKSVYHLYVVSVDDPAGISEALAEQGVEARSYYRTPIHRQPATEQDLELTGTELASARNLALPMSPTLRDDQVEVVVRALASARAAA
jgi:dTDP-3-amino-3,4,6-trideoxy-alpha-D-glucose transaminase